MKAVGAWQQSGNAAPDKQAEGHELERLLKLTINQLEPEQREVLVLYDMNGLSYKEIVVATQLPIGTIKSRLHRARLTLADVVNRWKKGESVESLVVNKDNKRN